jgi:hypothetical protein
MCVLSRSRRSTAVTRRRCLTRLGAGSLSSRRRCHTMPGVYWAGCVAKTSVLSQQPTAGGVSVAPCVVCCVSEASRGVPVQLLTRDPLKRLGCGPGDANEIKVCMHAHMCSRGQRVSLVYWHVCASDTSVLRAGGLGRAAAVQAASAVAACSGLQCRHFTV